MLDSDYVDGCRYKYIAASGATITDCLVLGYRTLFDVPFSPFEMESWIMHFEAEGPEDDEVEISFEDGHAGWTTGLWRSLEGPAFVAESDGNLRIWRGDRKKRWEDVKLGARLRGVWGLSDRCVYAWGQVRDDHRMFRYDGRTWSPMPSPGNISVLHGLASDMLYAVGYEGMMSRWDGQAWKRVPIRVKSNFMGLFVAGPDEMYATTESGELWEGTSHGWSKRAEIEDEPLQDVAKFKGKVWVAGGEAGLLRLKEKTRELECVKPNIEATGFDARGNLLITCEEIVVESKDGKSFMGFGEEVLRETRANKPKLWEEEEEEEED